jgi:hypothetical protein
MPFGLHELRAVLEHGPDLRDRRDALTREVPQQALLNLLGKQRFALPRQHDGGLLLHVRFRERGEQDLAQPCRSSTPTWRARGGSSDRSDSLNGIKLHQLPQIPGSGDFLPNFLPKNAK